MSKRSSVSNVREQVELEDCLDFGKEVTSTVQPRWKRKALASASRTPKRARKTPRKTPKTGKTPNHDRFIPNRSAMDLANAHFNMHMSKENGDTKKGNPAKAEFNKALADKLGATSHRVLAFRNKAPAPTEGYQNSLKVLYSQNKASSKVVRSNKVTRHIPSAPERILDAPELIDDYYLNLIDWSSGNLLAVALGDTVYLWNAATGGIEELCRCEGEDDYISSVKFVQEGGGYLAIGTNYNEVQLWDVENLKQLRRMDGHTARVSSLDWNNHILSSGGRDSLIVHHDVRVASHKVATLEGHTQEVCGLKWSPDGNMLASGGNDNLLCLWDARGGFSGATSTRAVEPFQRLTEHQAAVKALAWCPFQRNVLASGGGTADRTIKFWNAANGSLLNSIDTGSQVCSLLWSPHEKELLSSHGFSENQLCLWKFPSMVKVKELTGHTARVLHLANGPDGATVCSAAADETLRFWNVFGTAEKKAKGTKGAAPRYAGISRNIR